MVLRVIACLAAFCAVLEYHPSEADVRCLQTTVSADQVCEGDFCAATLFVGPMMEGLEGGWLYQCKFYPWGASSCEEYAVLYRTNDRGFQQVFIGCCEGDWCSNDTSVVSLPTEYYVYKQSLETSSLVDPFTSSSAPELVITSSISASEPAVSVTLPPSANRGIAGTSVAAVVQSSGCDDATSTGHVATSANDVATTSTELSTSSVSSSGCDDATSTGHVATSANDVATTSTELSTSSVSVQPSGESPTNPATGNMDYATLSFMLIILVCFLICVIALMFVAMVIWWIVWYRRLERLAKFKLPS